MTKGKLALQLNKCKFARFTRNHTDLLRFTQNAIREECKKERENEREKR